MLFLELFLSVVTGQVMYILKRAKEGGDFSTVEENSRSGYDHLLMKPAVVPKDPLPPKNPLSAAHLSR